MFDSVGTGKWWDIGLNLVEGCTKVSPGCDNCWSLTAANMRRFNPNPKIRARVAGTVAGGLVERPFWTGQVNLQWQDLDKIGRSRKPQVYTFWTDLFHPGVPDEFFRAVLSRIIVHPRHFYIICTKRSERASAYFAKLLGLDFSRRLMLMTTVENQPIAELRLPFLLQIPGVLHGVSIEPGLRFVDLTPYLGTIEYDSIEYPGLSWVICGGETGPHARPMHPDWVRSSRDQCVAAGVPFFFKSWGEWQPGSDARKKTLCVYDDGRIVEFTMEAIRAEERRSGIEHNKCSPLLMARVGKKTAGRFLDGRTWDEMPMLEDKG